MKIRFIICALCAAALAAGIANALPPPNIALAKHPQCFAAGDKVYVRGSVVVAWVGDPVQGARVEISYGPSTKWVTTGSDGIYLAEFPRTTATDVREVATSIPAPTGRLVPVIAREGSGKCHVPAASIGALRVEKIQ